MSHFRLVCILRVAFLCATVYLFFYLLLQTAYYATLTTVASLVAYQTWALIHYVERTNRDLVRFLDTIRYEDFSQSFSGLGLGSSFDGLKAAFNRVLDAFRKTRAEKEEHHRYLQTVIQHIGIGLLCFEPDGRVELANTAALRLLRAPQLRNLRDLEPFSKPLVAAFFRLRSGDSALVRVEDSGDQHQFAIYATELRMRGRELTLVSIQDIRSELEEKEMEAWQNLIRVLTHEIMNSVTPIASLAATARDLLTADERTPARGLSADAIQDIHDAVNTIQKRSEGLLHFVDTYRRLTRTAKPVFQIFPARELFARVHHLMQTEIASRSIAFHTAVDPDSLELTADPELIEQVLINLLLNAVQALEGRPGARIDLTARMDGRGRVLVQVRDNGPGILEDVQEKIFIPFFTTKRDGSGIGLSLCRQIMRAHRGAISVRSRPGEETVFTLRF